MAQLAELPAELWLHIFRFVPWRYRAALRPVSTAWLGLVDTAPHMWDDVPWDERDFLAESCARGELRAARWLADKFNLGAARVYECAAPALYAACHSGALQVAQWVVLDLMRGAVPRAAATEAVIQACSGGHLEVVKWLIARFEPDASDRRVQGWVRIAVNHDCFDLLRYLFVEYPAAAAAVCADAAWFLNMACCRGSREVIELLVGAGYRAVNGQAVRALDSACGGGHLAVAQMVVTQFGIDRAELRRYPSQALAYACQANAFEIARWLVETFGAETFLLGAEANTSDVLRSACRRASVGDVQWLLAQIRQVGTTDARLKQLAEDALASACGEGRAAVAQYIIEHFGLPRASARVWSDLALTGLCVSNSAEMLQWVTSGIFDLRVGLANHAFLVQIACEHGFPLLARTLVGHGIVTVSDLCTHFWDILGSACVSLEMVQWLLATIGTDGVAEFDPYCEQLWAAVLHKPRLEIVQWVVEYYGIGEMTADRVHILAHACVGGNLDVVKYLVRRLSIGADSVRACRAGYHACVHGNLFIAKWLHRTFSLGPADFIMHSPDRPPGDFIGGGYTWNLTISAICTLSDGVPILSWLINGVGVGLDGLPPNLDKWLRHLRNNQQYSELEILAERFGIHPSE